ncbi:ATP-dependent DNA helicase-like protein II [Sporormia fimetaria CBS 119925]|uniref:ATP-dependent DNA helicase II subunit 2 n=1 Tax=Sporormia fimetaria CBS 119925 TaxID=1340428 RepID=A0A6A6V2K3_9PLEO|nr:ATP-dependent DNA helicase-like protein II [Sporormia fimetaria CBS 119925]
MAQKEATVYVLDLGRSMGEKRHGRDKTNLEWAMQYVWDKITTTVATGRKTALMGVVGYRTDETDLLGVIEDDEGYDNICVFSEVKQFLLQDVRDLQQRLKPCKSESGDLFSAIAVAIQMIKSATEGKTGPLKFERRIIVISDGYGQFDTDDLDQFAAQITHEKSKIDITVLGVDFDDPENGYKEEDKDSAKAENEEMIRKFVEDDCGGIFGTLAEAVEQLEIPRLKETRAVPSFKGLLTLGDPEKYDSTMTIDVERYPCTMIAKPPTASSFVMRTDLASQAGPSIEPMDVDSTGEQLSAVRNQRVYQVDDPDATGHKINVEPDDLERGYEYGRTAVHISESDANIVKLETTPGLDIIGFLPAEKFERYLAMSRTNFVLPQKANRQAQLALSSFIHALYEADCYAVARLVVKELKAPVIVLLVPRIELDFEALIDVELPFEEDMRRYKFPTLDKKLTVSGKVITQHRDLPNADLMEAMSSYVDSMDLSTFEVDEDGAPTEYMKFEDTFSPLLHRINQVIRWRATNNDLASKLPDPPRILTKYSAPPPDLLAKTEDELTALKSAADVKKVPPKQKGRGKRRREDREKPLSGLDIDELLGNPKRVKIDPQKLVPSFKQALSASDDLEVLQEAVNDMGGCIKELITGSVGESAYGRALEAIRVMRDEVTELEEPDMYNGFIRDLKQDLLDGKLGGDRREMWWSIRGSRYGLIDRKRSFASAVTEEEAAEFYKG